MKYVFTIQTSADGLQPIVATNIKALFNAIAELDYSPITIFDKKEVIYNYSNLVKYIRQAQKENLIHMVTIYNAAGDYIDVTEVQLRSK